jgi:hypothetical protein
MSVAMAADTSARLTDAGLELVPVVESGLQLPLFLTHAGDGSGQLFVVEQGGIIRIIDRGALQNTPFLDIRDRVWRKGDEQGLLGLAFHPDHKANGRFFAHITDAKMGRQSSRSIAAKAAACRLQATPNTFSWSCRNPISTTMAG